MGQGQSTSDNNTNCERQKTLSDAQIRSNIENLFKAPQTDNNNDTVKIVRTETNKYDTSPVVVDTIVDNQRGGNSSRLTVMPLRKRYKDDQKSSTSNLSNVSNTQNKNNQSGDNLDFIGNVVYNNQNGGSNNTLKNNIFSAKQSSLTKSNSNTFSPTSAELIGGAAEAFSPTSAEQPNENIGADIFSPTSIDPSNDDINNNNDAFSPTSVDMHGGNILSDANRLTENPNSIDGEIQAIRKFINKTKQQGGNQNNQQFNTQLNNQQFNNQQFNNQQSINQPQITSGQQLNTQPFLQSNTMSNGVGKPRIELLSEEGLADIRDSLTRSGVKLQNGGNGKNKGNMLDDELKSFRDNILEAANVSSATSPDPSSSLKKMKGGASAKSEKTDKSTKEKEDENDDDDDDDDNDEDEDEDEDENDDEDEDEDEEDEEENEEDGLAINSGAKNKSKTEKTPQERRNDLNKEKNDSESDSSSDDSNGSGSSDNSSSEEEEINDDGFAIMQNSIEKSKDRRENNSKYLKNNGYKITSNSDRDYKIKNNTIYSSDVHTAVGGSDYLNTMRNRDRSG
jgi:hypothetical protein